MVKLQILKHLYGTDHQCLLDRQQLSVLLNHTICFAAENNVNQKLFTLTYHLQKAASLSALLETAWMDTHKPVCWSCQGPS